MVWENPVHAIQAITLVLLPQRGSIPRKRCASRLQNPFRGTDNTTIRMIYLGPGGAILQLQRPRYAVGIPED